MPKARTNFRSFDRSAKEGLVAVALVIALLCSAVAAAPQFAGWIGTSLQLAGILLPLFVGVLLNAFTVLGSRALYGQPLCAMLLMTFLASACISTSLMDDKFFGFMFMGAISLAFFVSGALWNLNEEKLLNGLKAYTLLCSLATLLIWLRFHEAETRFDFLIHPNLWGLICFGNFCLSWLFANPYLRFPVQIASVVIILGAQSRSALLATILSGLCLMYMGLRSLPIRRQDKMLSLLLLVSAAICCTIVAREQLTKLLSEAFMIDDEYRGAASGFTGRTDLWEQGISIFLTSPFFGMGPRTEANYTDGNAAFLHSGYISSLVQFGAIGSAMLFAFILIRLQKIWLMAASSRRAANVGFSLIVGYLAEAVFEPRLLSIGNPVSLLVILFLLQPRRTTEALSPGKRKIGTKRTRNMTASYVPIPASPFRTAEPTEH